MNVPQNDLDDIWRRAEAIRNKVYVASGYVRDGKPDLAQAALLDLLTMQVPGIMGELERAGAQRSGDRPEPEAVPLELLNTRLNRERLYRLDDAMTVSRAVDAERGIDEGGVTHLLTTLVELVKLEVEGPKGTGE